jgi:hypothetical protein
MESSRFLFDAARCKAPREVTQPRTAKDSERRHPWLVCAVLAVIFARGPVPWFHTHETLAHHAHSDDALAWHVRHFHAPGDEDEHAWHIHWTLPWHIVNCPCQHDPASVEEMASALGMPFDVAQSASINQADADVHARMPPLMLSVGERDDWPRWESLCVAGLHFLETYFPGVTLRALFCVAQC